MDIRIVSTKNRIQGGLISVIKQKPLYQIKDKDIINEAEVSAASYYKYYRDKSQVLKDLETELIKQFSTALYADSKGWLSLKYGPNKKEISNRIDNNLSNLIAFTSSKKEVITVLISKNGDPAFKAKMLELTAAVIKRLLIRFFQIYDQLSRLDGKKFEIDTLANVYSYAFLGSFFFWLNHTDKMSVNDCKKMVKDMILRSPYDISTHELNNK
ncbi:TetR-like C-terminal domain-containing protein [Lactobacillus ultunensis]|uniref:TetR-like C-terminal domain-containing protein n=1 Tax=Lactobacillus ultunensis TaxID=227945 RepID=UPI001913A98D|nr:TetR-like C-terminal domain-containing protein [Lactobacillus ultunensis]QQP28855.1 TetR/AcrR family transcriptional regulator [Lactobacillus ultunensis]